MNRTMLTVAGLLGASSPLLVDSAVKGVGLLALAAVAAMILRRDSAATRHLVWLLAIGALLVVPVMSAMLPEWRVLPEWAGISPEPVVVETSPPSIARPADYADHAVELPRNTDPVEVERPSATAYQPAAGLPDSRAALVTAEIAPEPAVWSRNWIHALPLVWAIGFCVLILRLMAARWMLWNAEWRGTVIWSPARPAKATHDPVATAFEAVCLQLGIHRPVTLLVHPGKTIPVVWGTVRCHLMLPAAARQWSSERLRCVLLHELAHVKRRDTVAQLLARIACALHWFNPLAWFAAWRLGVEGERACDDLVLASGVRPSAYAGHLLEVVTDLSPARWTQSCGLAMARKSSLEGRLRAVLGERLNRRGVSMALAAIALATTVGIAVPIAMLRAADQEPGEQPKPTTTDMKPEVGEKLNPAAEEKLRWGEPVNGLRAAIAIRPAPGKPKGGDLPNLYLVVQNVSDAPIRLGDATAATKLRELYVELDGKTQTGFVCKNPTGIDVMLQPREVVFLLVFPPDSKRLGVPTTGSVMAEGALKDPHRTLVTEMKIEHAPAGAWTGKLRTGETSGAAAAGRPEPKGKEAQALFRKWLDGARVNGKIPGGALGPLARAIAKFIKLNPTDERAPKLAELLKRIDTSHDWTQAEGVSLLNDVTAIYPTMPRWAEDEELFSLGGTIRTGRPLPAELKDAPWGEPQPNGLRMAWLVEPRAAEYRLGTPLKSRILFQNAGKNTLVFRALTWYQSGAHKARDAKGLEIKIESTYWTTIPQIVACRLAPGEFMEVVGAGIGVGARRNPEDWQNTRVGAWIEAKAGDDVTFSPAPVALNGRRDEVRPEDEPDWWLTFIKDRLSLDSPLPADAAERTRVLNREVSDLFATEPTPEETAAFVSDRKPDVLDVLARCLAQRAGVSSFTGSLKSGPTRFRVLPADPDAAKRPRAANNPGRYTLREGVVLAVSRRSDGERVVNHATIQFSSSDTTKPVAGEPYELTLPDGYDTWAAAWVRGGTVLWLQDRSGVRGYDFSNLMKVKEEAAQPDKVPAEIREALRGALAPPRLEAEPSPAAESTGAGATPVTDDPLEREVSLATKDVPLKVALEKIAADAGLGVEFDSEALKRVGLDLEQPVSASLQNVPLSKVLGQLIDWQSHFGAMRAVHRGKLVFTTLDAWQARIVERLPAWIKPLYNQGLLATLDDNDEVATLSTSRVMNDDLLERLKTLPKLRELDIEVTRGITPAGLAHLAELRNLEKLTLCAVNEEGPRLGDAAIRGVAGLPALRELSIIECGTTDDGAKLLEQLPQLSTLSLYQEGRLTDAALESIGKLARLKSLSLTSHGGTQQLGRMGFSAAGIRRLGGLKDLESLGLVGHEVPADALDFPKLTSLSLGHPLVDDAVAARVSQLRQLRGLELSYCGIRDSGLKQIATLPELRRLDISSGVITDEGIKALRAHPRLEHVSLRAMDVTDQSLRYLARIPTLTRLDLHGSGQTGAVAGRNFSIAGLQALKSLPKLDTLYLTNFDLPGGGYIGLKELKQLRQLSFMMCNVNDGDLDALEDALPNTSITPTTGYKTLRKPLSK